MYQLKFKANTERLLDKHLTGESIDYRQIISLFIPILIDQAFIISLNMVNAAMISSAGVAAISAVNMVDSLNIFLVSVFIAMSTGGTVVVAQYKGSGNDLMVSKAASSTVSACAILALALSLILVLFHQPLLSVLFGAASPEVMDNAKVYLLGGGVSFVGIAITEAVCGALRGIGKSRASLMLSLFMNLTYVALNLVFINLLHMGALGMTIAINIARYLAAACALYFLVKRDTDLHFQLRSIVQVNLKMLRKIFSIGIPFAAEQMFFNGGKMLTQIFIVGLGTYAIATNAISGSLAGVSQIPANALSLTLVTVVGQCIGRRNVEDARKFTKTFLWLASFSFVLTGVIMMALFHPLVSLFHPPKEIVGDIFTVLLINLIAQVPLWAISFIMPSALRAAGDSKFTSLVSMLSMWLFRVILGYVLGIVLHWGIVGVWLAMNCEWGVRGTVFLLRFMGKKWYQHRLID
ncbi:MATE family efflux transporter [Paenibacillus rhizosphaerae]|uniref:Probable multidrug resistance protein NorM n=1 Tax=Paenibacillus rhizosphaerae TaxID=297318 RepID=A0A1R1EKE7_9BACL|nr:MATE family efflux transporter [Paenibacillus rhizosphaerae]OMF52280.1 MATE family efflux transporter [Paenibacillus rhizosphaerae]